MTTMTRRAGRLRWLLAAVLALALVAAACDDDNKSDSGGGGTDTTESGGGGGDVAAERVKFFQQAVSELPINTPIASVPKDKKVFYVQCSVVVCEEIKTGIEAAAEALGWTFESQAHQDTPETVAAAFDAAIAAEPDVVLTSGNPREWFASQLDELAAKDVPVIAWSIPEPYEPGDGIVANLLTGDDYYFYGVLMADYAAQQSKNKKILFVALPTFPVLGLVQDGFNAEIGDACPDCDVKTIEVQVTDIGQNLPGQVVSELQADPDLDYVVYAFGGMMFGVPDALEAAGLLDQAKAVSQAGGVLNFDFIRNDQQQEAEVALASEFLGWRAIDASARVLAGESPGKAETPELAQIPDHPDILVGGMPLQILTKDDVPPSGELWPGVDGFQDKFKELWGVS